MFPTRCDTNRPVQSQKQARSLKFLIKEEKKLTAKLICVFVFAYANRSSHAKAYIIYSRDLPVPLEQRVRLVPQERRVSKGNRVSVGNQASQGQG